MVRTLHFHCKGLGLDPWLGNEDPAACTVQPKNKEIIIIKYFLKKGVNLVSKHIMKFVLNEVLKHSN